MEATHVYLDEEGGGIAHPTRDLVGELEAHVDVREVHIDRERSSDPRYWFRLGRRAAEGTDVVHVHFEYGSFGSLFGVFLGSMYPAFAYGVDAPMVTTLHNLKSRRPDVSLSDPGSVLDSTVRLVKSPIDLAMVRRTDFFVPFMKEQERLLRARGVPADRIERIPLVAEADPDFRDPAACKRELGLEGARVVTAFGWVRRTKGYDLVVDVLEELPEDTVFLVAGGTRTGAQEAYLEELRERAAAAGVADRVEFTGYVGREEHPTIMNATDVMVFPYRDNRASDALARSLSYHLPVVASDNEEFSAVAEEWGCLRTAGTKAELAAVLREVLTDAAERERLRTRARAYAGEMNWATVAERVHRIYRRLVDGDLAR